MPTKALLSPTDETQIKTANDIVAELKSASEQQVWSIQGPVNNKPGAQAAFQPAYRVNPGMTDKDFIEGKLKKIVKRQEEEMRLIHDSLNPVLSKNLEELKKIHDIEKSTHFTADLDDVPLTYIYPDYIPIYLENRKILAGLNSITVELASKKKTLSAILGVSSLRDDEAIAAKSALKSAIQAGIDTLKSYKTLSKYHFKQDKLKKDLRN